jgi:mandelate racemase
MRFPEKLTIESIEVRAVSIPMRRPIVSKVGKYPEWPLILIDVRTREGIIGRIYLESYLRDAIRYIGPIILDRAKTLKNASVAPLDLYQKSMNRLHLLGRQGLTLVALAGIDMAMWDISWPKRQHFPWRDFWGVQLVLFRPTTRTGFG